MNWDGVERRQLGHCESHLDLVKSVAIIETTIVNLDKRINGSLKSIEKHMDEGIRWRIAIVGVGVTLLVQFMGFIVVGTRFTKQIEVNTCRLDTLESLHPRYSDETLRTPVPRVQK